MTISMGKRIAQRRKDLGMTQDQLAEHLGVTKQAVSKWENEQCYPDITIIPELAEIFHCSTDSLFGIPACEHTDPIAHSGGQDRVTWSFSMQTPDKSDPGGSKPCSNTNVIFSLAVWVLLLGLSAFWGAVARNRGLGTACGYWDYGWTAALVTFGLVGIRKKSPFRFLCALSGGFLLVQSIVRLPISLNAEMVFPAVLILLAVGLLSRKREM